MIMSKHHVNYIRKVYLSSEVDEVKNDANEFIQMFCLACYLKYPVLCQALKYLYTSTYLSVLFIFLDKW